MDGLSAAASVIAVVDISAKVLVLCSQYYKAVASARTDIERLQGQVQGIKTTLDHARDLIESPQGVSLSTSRDLEKQLGECKAILEKLHDELQTCAHKAKHRAWIRSLKWPFSSKEVQATIESLERHHRQIMDGLLVDQTSLLLHIKDDVQAIVKNEDASAAKRVHFMVHFDQDANFVPRPAIQEQIDTLLAGTTSRIALIGFGGFGKSQIAIQLAYTFRSCNPEKSVFWVYGASRATFEESYRSIADKLSIPGRHDPKTNILTLVRDWLQRDDVAPWLLILDNADEGDVFFDKQEGSPLASYLPKGSNGKILITSRHRDVAEKLTGNQKATIHLPEMTSGEALELLQERLISEHDQAAASDLINVLDFIPLAIHQAAAYINRRRISIKTYIEMFKESAATRARLLQDEAGDIRRHDSVSNSVMGTWYVTFEQISRESPKAFGLLALLSCFQPQAIPRRTLNLSEYVLRLAVHWDEDSTETLDDVLDVLFAYSVISKGGEPHLYNMHSLVHIYMQTLVSEMDAKAMFERLFLHLVTTDLEQNQSVEGWANSRFLLPHVDRLFETRPDDGGDAIIWVRLLNATARCYLNMGSYVKGMHLARRALTAGEELFIPGSPSLMETMKDLVGLYELETNSEDSEKVQLQLIGHLRTTVEDNHPSVLVAKCDLADIYRRQHRWDEAEKLHLQVLEIYSKTPESNYDNILVSMGRLSAVFRDQGCWREAEELGLQMVEGSKRVFGADSSATLDSMVTLAKTYEKQKEWQEAEELYLEVIETAKRVLGAEDPKTLTYMLQLGFLYSEQGRWEEEAALCIPAMEGLEESLGEDHMASWGAMFFVAMVLRKLNRPLDASGLMNRSLTLCRRHLGAEHPTAKVFTNVVALWEREMAA